MEGLIWYEMYQNHIDSEPSYNRNAVLTKYAQMNFKETIERYRELRERQIKKRSQIQRRKNSRNYYKKIKYTDKYFALKAENIRRQKENRKSPLHNNLQWILDNAKPNPDTGTVALKTYECSKTGYLFCVILSKTYQVHRLIWMSANNSFIPKNLEINHKDFDKTNNKIGNLELMTRQENLAHYYDFKRPEKRKRNKDIRKLSKEGKSNRELAIKFDLNQETISQIIHMNGNYHY